MNRLLLYTKRIIGKSPEYFVTDGLPAYMKLSRRVFGKDTNHLRHIHLKMDRNNNKMERINGTICDREKTFRDLKSFDSPVINGFQVYYIYMREYEAINKTPAEQALIKVDGKNKWITLIQNASLYRISE